MTRAAVLLAALAVSVAAQAENPSQKPEPRRRVGDDPRRIFLKLTSKSEAERRTAAQQLNWPKSEPAPAPFDARLLLVNLDMDEEQEAIFVFTGTPLATVALVFDRQEDVWWQVGNFFYGWHWDANQAEALIELREIVEAGRKDIIVREPNGGTGFARTQVSIFRLHNSRLYRVFSAAEHELYANKENTGEATESRRIEFETDPGLRAFLVVHHRKITKPDTPTKRNPVMEKSDCSAYRWEADRFTFVLDRPAAIRLCQASTDR